MVFVGTNVSQSKLSGTTTVRTIYNGFCIKASCWQQPTLENKVAAMCGKYWFSFLKTTVVFEQLWRVSKKNKVFNQFGYTIKIIELFFLCFRRYSKLFYIQKVKSIIKSYLPLSHFCGSKIEYLLDILPLSILHSNGPALVIKIYCADNNSIYYYVSYVC